MGSRFSLVSLFVALTSLGCAGARSGSVAKAAPTFDAELEHRGETIYWGRVFPLRGRPREPTFVYERRVEESAAGLLSTHITRDPAGEIVLAESAKHAPDYALTEYVLYRNQLDQSGRVRVDGRQVTFTLFEGGKERHETETVTAPVVVGPTLVGYLVRHLPDLSKGQVLNVRLAVLDRLETIGFDLESVPAEANQTRIQMRASSAFIRLIVDPLYFTFETASSKLVRLEGRVPPKVRRGGAWADFDARVEYQFVAPEYR